MGKGTGGGRFVSPTLLDNGYGRLRSVAAAPDGSLWVTMFNRDGRGAPVRITRLSGR